MIIGLAHMRIKLMAKKTNLEKVKKFVKEANNKGTRMIVFPSMFNIGPIFSYYTPTRIKQVIKNQAEKIPGTLTDFLSNLALEENIYIATGPIIERAGPKLFLSSFMVTLMIKQ